MSLPSLENLACSGTVVVELVNAEILLIEKKHSSAEGDKLGKFPSLLGISRHNVALFASTCLSFNTVPILHHINTSSQHRRRCVFLTLSKPGVVDHLATDLENTGAEIAVTTEAHFKQRHTDFTVSSVSMATRCFAGQREAGLAAAWRCTCSQQSSQLSACRRFRQVVTVPLRFYGYALDLFLAALYHPPRPVYNTTDLLNCIENCVAEISHNYPCICENHTGGVS